MTRSRSALAGSTVVSAALVTLGIACSGGRPPGLETTGQEVITTNQINGDSLPPKTVVLTYDDGPDEHTLELAQYLAEQGVKATFFVNGRRYCKTYDANGVCTTPQDTRACNDGQMQAAVPGTVKHYPESMIDEILKLGHRMANHTQDHCHLPGQKNVADLAFEFKATQDILDRHICDNVFLFRAPFGEWDNGVVTRINSQMGFNKIVGPINWDIDGNDWACWQRGAKPADCAAGYLSILNGRPNKNGIFLMHDRPEFNVGSDAPLQMTKILVPKLKADGFKFATMDDVLKLTPNPMGSGCPNAAPADGGAQPGDAGAASDAGTQADAGTSAGGSSGADASAGGATGSGGSQTSSGGATGSGGAGVGSGGASGSASGGSTGTGGKASGGSSGKGGNTPEPGNDSQPQDGGGCAVAGTGGVQPSAPLALLLGFTGIGLARLRRRRR